MNNDSSVTRECALVNFRPALGLNKRVYRCGSTDELSTVVNEQDLKGPEKLFLHDITLNVDLRLKMEFDQEQASAWTANAPGGSFQVLSEDEVDAVTIDNDIQRAVVHFDLTSNVFPYIDKHWLGEDHRQGSQNSKAITKVQWAAVKERGGLPALYQVLLEANHEKLCTILKLITVNLEKGGTVAINCTQGKDRTGLVTMLLQSAVGIPNRDIVADFAESHHFDSSHRGSAAMSAAAAKFKVDTSILSGALPEVMNATLDFLCTKYGSVSPGFLNEIGYDDSWRNRLVTALDESDNTKQLT